MKLSYYLSMVIGLLLLFTVQSQAQNIDTPADTQALNEQQTIMAEEAKEAETEVEKSTALSLEEMAALEKENKIREKEALEAERNAKMETKAALRLERQISRAERAEMKAEKARQQADEQTIKTREAIDRYLHDQ
jgi:hypothetical protein